MKKTAWISIIVVITLISIFFLLTKRNQYVNNLTNKSNTNQQQFTKSGYHRILQNSNGEQLKKFILSPPVRVYEPLLTLISGNSSNEVDEHILSPLDTRKDIQIKATPSTNSVNIPTILSHKKSNFNGVETESLSAFDNEKHTHKGNNLRLENDIACGYYTPQPTYRSMGYCSPSCSNGGFGLPYSLNTCPSTYPTSSYCCGSPMYESACTAPGGPGFCLENAYYPNTPSAVSPTCATNNYVTGYCQQYFTTSTPTTSPTVYKRSNYQTFSYTGASTTFTVPPGVSAITVDAYGAQGYDPSSGGNTYGGKGGYIQSKLTVNPGDVLTVVVGGQNGWPCAGLPGAQSTTCPYAAGVGGGATYILNSATTLLVMAGGGSGILTGNSIVSSPAISSDSATAIYGGTIYIGSMDFSLYAIGPCSAGQYAAAGATCALHR